MRKLNWAPVIYTSMEEVEKSNRLFVGEYIILIGKEDGPACYEVKSISPLELVKIEIAPMLNEEEWY